MPLLSVVTLPQVPGTVPSSTARAQRRAPHASPGRPLRRRCQERGAGGAGPGARAARHSPRRLKLSDKVLRNFFILPIFSGGCGSMRSHIWATPGRGNFPKLVQSGAQTTASARRGEGGASASTSASASASSSGREATRGARSGRPSAGGAGAWPGCAAGALYVVPGAASVPAAAVAPRRAAAPLIFPPL